MKTYTGSNLEPGSRTVGETRIMVNDGSKEYELPLLPSLKLRNHSPTGFSWGYNGSGPAQLALAILLDWSGDVPWSLKHYQTFKERAIASIPQHVDLWGFGEGMIRAACAEGIDAMGRRIP